LKEDYHIELPESPEYETLGGLLMTTLQKVPQTGDEMVTEGMKLTIVEMLGQRISKVNPSTPRHKCRGLLRVDPERRFLFPALKGGA
jgi:CBS domain containing-hemolysin-like protein